mmetsp:Transcript_18000/g.44334  ORF Transcript_18000/g.44334 Transcript_18000/m.44334 type:complete len:615 (+) Transcript_18000:9-1853(+)
MLTRSAAFLCAALGACATCHGFRAGAPSRSLLARSASSPVASPRMDMKYWEFDPMDDEKIKEMGRRPKLLKTGADFVPKDVLEGAKGTNKFEKVKNAKDGTAAWTEVHELSAKLRAGETTWEDLDLDDINLRLKWAGLFHRAKHAPKTFMIRCKVHNGILTSEQARLCADLVEPYGDELGVLDVTTRQNMQLRGITLEDASNAVTKLIQAGIGCYQSGLDNVRNVVGNPLAGIDPNELVDTRETAKAINDMVTGNQRGNPEWAHLPRKFNIAVSGSRDDFSHTTINDIGLQAMPHPDFPGKEGFNVVLGGYFSIKRAAESVPFDAWIPKEDAVPFCEAVLEVFRDHGERKDRQKTRMMWLLEDKGLDWMRDMVNAGLEKRGVSKLAKAAPEFEDSYARRDIMGVHPQVQEGKSWVGITIPTGRLFVAEMRALADLADKYSAGELRMTVEQNIILPNVDNDRVDELLKEPALTDGRLKVEQEMSLLRGLVACTGSQFCGQGLVETKLRAERVTKALDEQLDMPRLVRMHWTGCPNSCGQAQVGDIGLMGSPAKKLNEETGKMMAVEGLQIFLGGAVGERPELGSKFEKAVPAADEDLIPFLKDMLIEKFGAKAKA